MSNECYRQFKNTAVIRVMTGIFNQFDFECSEIQKLLAVLFPIYNNDPSVTMVNLNSYDINTKGTKALSIALQQNTNVVVLFLENNSISSTAFATYLAPAIATHPSLKYIYLSYNSIGTTGSLALSNSFNKQKQSNQHNSVTATTTTKLEVLKLSYNNISTLGAIELLQSLPESVHTISLDGNDINENGVVTIAECLRYNTTLKRLDVVVQSPANDDRSYIRNNHYINNNINNGHRNDSTISCQSSATMELAITAFCNILENDNRTLTDLRLLPTIVSTTNTFVPHQNLFTTEQEEILFILLRLNKVGRKSFGVPSIDRWSWATIIENVTYGRKNYGTCIMKSNCINNNHSSNTFDTNSTQNPCTAGNTIRANVTTICAGEHYDGQHDQCKSIDNHLVHNESITCHQNNLMQQQSNFITSQVIQQSILGNPNLIFSILTSRPDLLV